MRVILDLDTCMLTVPKNFFDYIAKQNAVLKSAGVLDDNTRVTAEKLISKAFNTAISDTQTYLRTNPAPGKQTAKKTDTKGAAAAAAAVK